MADVGARFENFVTRETQEKSKQITGPFRATRLWHILIDCLRSEVVVKRQRHNFFRQYDNVFSGSNAVDVIDSHLRQMESEICKQEITRENAVKVCQVLMDNSIFVSVPYGLKKFEDSNKSFYRFIEDNCGTSKNICNPLIPATNNVYNQKFLPASPERERKSLDNIISSSKLSPSMLSGRRRHSFVAAVVSNLETNDTNKRKIPKQTPRGIFKQNSFRMSLLKRRPKYQWINQEFVQKISLETFDVSEELINNTRDKALCHLLTFVDVPILEDILNTPTNMQRVKLFEDGLTIENENVKLHTTPTKYPLAKEFYKIPWVRAATACLMYVPDGIGKLWSVQSCKLHSYKQVKEYYQNLPFPILPDSFLPLYTSILELHKATKFDRTQKALQLLATILPWQRRDQLYKLLLFLNLVAQDLSINVDKELSNDAAVVRDFVDCFLCHPLLSREHRSTLVLLFVKNVKSIFKFPHWVCHSGISFCEKYLLYRSHILTKKELENLFYSIFKSDISDKKKSIWLRKFKRSHYEIYEKCIPIV
ncbi:DEP domain-containing protein 7-like [Centruroides sculpturatus]|uniref:DEP domain-containing protein 7-like n=1 Tax=Centruroides sculpturatus TaxID=218467 RepID=UPI000C6DC18C|nr:DEP domain-containing protein 7-like [Centruroides sculpturatus]